jgi:hypothetical protein
MFEILTAVVSVAALALSVFSVLRRRKLTLAQIAALACDHGAAAEGKTLPRWRLAYEAAVVLDEGDNGKRDYTDRQLRLAVDAEAAKRGWKAGQ